VNINFIWSELCTTRSNGTHENFRPPIPLFWQCTVSPAAWVPNILLTEKKAMYDSIIYGAIILGLIIAGLIFALLIRREFMMRTFYFSVKTKRASFYVSVQSKTYIGAERIVKLHYENALISPIQGIAFMNLAYGSKAHCYTYNPDSDTFTII